MYIYTYCRKKLQGESMLMNTKSPMTVTNAICDILQTRHVSTQEDICANLRKVGLNVNQVRVSRILHKIGAIKLNENGKVIYRLPNHLASIAVSPNDSLKHLILKMSHNESMIIIHTSPGSAQLVAHLLDHKRQEIDILGTVAGDDTIFIAPKSLKNIKSIFKRIYEHMLAT